MMTLGGGNYNDGKNHDIEMEVRDYFAGFALQGILTKEYIDLPNVKEHIKSAYKIADMMMKERDK